MLNDIQAGAGLPARRLRSRVSWRSATAAMTSDVDQTAPIHASLAAKGLPPGDHLLDAGYVDAELLVDRRLDQGVRLVGPARPDVGREAQSY